MALKSKRSSFVYKPRDEKTIKERATRKSSRFDSIFKQGYDSFRPHQGDNLIRYMPPTWDDADHYGYTAHVHRNIGPDNATYLCLRKMKNKPCPCCEAYKEAKDAGESEEAAALATGERIISWILDRDADDPEKPILYDTSWTQDRDITSLCVNERSGEVLMIDHPDKGFDVSFKRSGTGLRTKYYGYAIAREDSPLHDSEKVQDEILEYVKENPVPDTLNFYDYDYLAGVLSGKVAEKDEVLDKDEDEDALELASLLLSKPKLTSKRQVVEEGDEVSFDTKKRGPRRDQQVDEEDETSSSRRPTRKSESVDEEVDEEAEERPARRSETVSRKPSNGRARVIEEEPDEESVEPAPRHERRSNTRIR